MNKLKNLWPYLLIVIVVFIFFYPVFKGKIPFPGDILINDNPYKTESYLGYAPGGYPNKAQGPDVTKEIYPWRYFSFSELKKGIVPFWNPHNFSGNPQIANFQTGVFYPLNLLYLIFPFNFSWTLIIMSEPVLAGIFMYLFLKKGIGLKDFPSFIGAVSFAFSSYMTVWIEYGNIGSTLAWLPLVLLFTKYFFKKLSILNFFGIVASLSLAILAGYIQGAFYIYVLCFLYYNYLVFSTKGAFENHKKNLIFLLSLFLPFVITFFQIFPTLELFLESTRGTYALGQIEKNLAPLASLVTIFFPDFFGNPATRNYWIDGTYIERVMYPGSVVLLFAFYALISKVKFGEKRFFAIVSLISLVVATDLPLVKYFYLIPVPVISTTVATREFSIFIFSLIVLGSIGLEHFLSEKEFKKIFAYAYLGFVTFIWALVFVLIRIIPGLSQNLKITQHNLIVPTIIIVLALAVICIKKINKNVVFAVIALLVVFDLFYFFNKITPFSPKTLVYPQTPVISYLQKNAGINRFWGYGSAYVSPNYQSVDGTYSPEGNDPLHLETYGQLLAASENGELPAVLPRPDANVAPGYGTNGLSNNFYRQRVLNLLGVKYVLNQDYTLTKDTRPDLSTFPDSIYKLVWQETPWQVYENKQSLPRFFITGDYRVEEKQKILSSIFNKNIDLGKTVFLEETPRNQIQTNSRGEVSLLSYKSNEIKFLVKTDGNSILFLSDNYTPGWRATVDGADTKVYRADYTFRAVIVPKGTHRITFYYYPINFILGLKISAGGVFLLLIVLFWIKKYEEKN